MSLRTRLRQAYRAFQNPDSGPVRPLEVKLNKTDVEELLEDAFTAGISTTGDPDTDHVLKRRVDSDTAKDLGDMIIAQIDDLPDDACIVEVRVASPDNISVWYNTSPGEPDE